MTTKSKGGRPPTGSPKWHPTKKVWQARIWLMGEDGRKREKLVDMPGIAEADKDRARHMAKLVVKQAIKIGAVPAEVSETCDEWFERWAEARREKGLTSVRNDEGRYGKWISPRIGRRSMKSIAKRDIEELVQELDASVRAEKLRWKTAINVWGVLKKMFADACNSKVLALRVRDDNPAREVLGPDRGAEREGPFLFPLEFQALMRCKRVPVRWKRIFALSTYLYTRGGELDALEWPDVSFDHRYVHLHQAVDSDTGDVKSTKTKANRKVPIESTLLPLLESMHRAADGEGSVVTSMPPREEWAARLRKYVQWALEDAGMAVRPELFADDETRRPLSFHDLRHTGITWRAIRGDDPLKIQRAAGHSDLKTTQRYINAVQVFDVASFGELFPALPASILSGIPVAEVSGSGFGVSGWPDSQSSHFSGTARRPQGDSNPR